MLNIDETKNSFDVLSEKEQILFLQKFASIQDFIEFRVKKLCELKAKEILKLENEILNYDNDINHVSFKIYGGTKYIDHLKEINMTLCVYIDNKFSHYLYLNNYHFNDNWKDIVIRSLKEEKQKEINKTLKKEKKEKLKYLQLKEKFEK